MGTKDRKLQFRPRARIIRTIGDQLISGPEAAVAELVKNAYDADARSVRITFFPPLSPGGGRIIIQDTGHGMSLADIRDKWMEPATSTKVSRRRSAVLNRLMMGSKGIGRFAAAKLGAIMSMTSVTDCDGSREAVLIPMIDWSLFDGETYLSDIEIDYIVEPTTAATGTEIEIRDLNESWTESRLRRLFTELRRLVSPLDADTDLDFSIFLDLSKYTVEECGFDGAAIVNGDDDPEEDGEAGGATSGGGIEQHQVTPFPLLTSSDYEVNGSFSAEGVFSGTMQVLRAGQAPREIKLNVPVQPEEDRCGTVGVRLFIFDRDAESLKSNMMKAGFGEMSAKEARDILDRTAGVAIYRDGFRIRPYGDAQTDWLTLDKRRIQKPTRHIGHNQVAGYVTVEGPDVSGLEERSSREGLEDNGAFQRLRNLIIQLLAQVVEPRRVDFRVNAGLQNTRNASFDEVRQLAELQRIHKLVQTLPQLERVEAERIVAEQSSLLIGKIEALEERQRVLEAKSSLGAIMTEIIHEGAPAAGFISRTTSQIQKNWKAAISNDHVARSEIQQALPLLRTSAKGLAELFRMLRPLSGGRRGAPQLFRPAESAVVAKSLLAGAHAVEIRTTGAWDVPEILGYQEDLTTALVNLVSNSIHWLEQSATENPWVEIRFAHEDSELAVYVQDNGPGVPAEFAEQIFDAGFTLKEGGTGLGLNIAREAVARSGGKLGFYPDNQDGALFEIRFYAGVVR
ncbi:MAG: ATP-binding protein [Brevundimonas sp.]|uniref:sensor histidine kinase n=1 Tax=Brevundimonas sp. TaxID=1871086 RepID=UPI00391B0F79